MNGSSTIVVCVALFTKVGPVVVVIIVVAVVGAVSNSARVFIRIKFVQSVRSCLYSSEDAVSSVMSALMSIICRSNSAIDGDVADDDVKDGVGADDDDANDDDDDVDADGSSMSISSPPVPSSS
jgi:hypothetical protein